MYAISQTGSACPHRTNRRTRDSKSTIGGACARRKIAISKRVVCTCLVRTSHFFRVTAFSRHLIESANGVFPPDVNIAFQQGQQQRTAQIYFYALKLFRQPAIMDLFSLICGVFVGQRHQLVQSLPFFFPSPSFRLLPLQILSLIAIIPLSISSQSKTSS